VRKPRENLKHKSIAYWRFVICELTQSKMGMPYGWVQGPGHHWCAAAGLASLGVTTQNERESAVIEKVQA